MPAIPMQILMLQVVSGISSWYGWYSENSSSTGNEFSFYFRHFNHRYQSGYDYSQRWILLSPVVLWTRHTPIPMERSILTRFVFLPRMKLTWVRSSWLLYRGSNPLSLRTRNHGDFTLSTQLIANGIRWR